jgi:hypothetical protein
MLEEKRQKIRLIQQRKVSEKELLDLKDLPQEIPVTLSIGHRIYSYISRPEEGVFLGTIAAVDLVEHTYRVVFDRQSIGSQTVHDYETKSVQPVQTIPIKAYLQTYRPKLAPKITNSNFQALINNSINTPQKFSATNFAVNSSLGFNNLLIEDLNTLNATNPSIAAALMINVADPMISVCSPFKLSTDSSGQVDLNSQFQTPLLNSSSFNSSNNKSKINNCKMAAINNTLGGFPIHLLLMITRLNKILNVKRDYVKNLNNMNTLAEKSKAKNLPFTKEFQMEYAIIILDLEKLNKDLSDYLVGVQHYCEEFSPEFRLKIIKKQFSSQLDQITNIDLKKIDDNISIKLDKKNRLSDLEFISFSNLDEINKHYSNESFNMINTISNIKAYQYEFTPLINKQLISTNNIKKVRSKHSIELISKLISLLLKLKDYLNFSERNNISSILLLYYIKTFSQYIEEVKKLILEQKNLKLFEKKSEIHFNHIKSMISRFNKLHAFKFEINPNFHNINQEYLTEQKTKAN